MAITPNTTFTSGAILTAAQMNRLPWGIIGRAERTSNQTGISTAADITGLTITWTANSSRIYRTTVYSIVQQDTANGLVFIRITDGANQQKQQWMVTTVATGFYTCCSQVTETGLSGSTTRKARADSQANTMSIQATSTLPAFILVEDLGEA
jgi:hypothetical protein